MQGLRRASKGRNIHRCALGRWRKTGPDRAGLSAQDSRAATDIQPWNIDTEKVLTNQLYTVNDSHHEEKAWQPIKSPNKNHQKNKSNALIITM
ncbi:hypothetical protein [Chromobacterium subtsugae]|uniref:hypothetical protein n=1 Tax=Chromobacterium subtsugae TaxID=251747 RepID=UPI0012D43D78|nr:hypothetical protein [Chromobacterium subtsugae]